MKPDAPLGDTLIDLVAANSIEPTFLQDTSFVPYLLNPGPANATSLTPPGGADAGIDATFTVNGSNSPPVATDGVSDVRFVRDIGLTRDMDQGAIAMTGNALDVALEGQGFFMVQGPNGPLYTRDGAFTLTGEGRLVTSDGRAVLSSGGAPIVFDPQGEAPVIGRDGAGSGTAASPCATAGCSPAFSSQMLMIGTSFANSV